MRGGTFIARPPLRVAYSPYALEDEVTGVDFSRASAILGSYGSPAISRLMKRSVLIAVALLMVGWSPADFRPLLEQYDVRTLGGQPELTWKSKVEDGVDYYQVRRKMRFDSDFQAIGPEIAARGNGHTYSFVDTELYKTSGEVVEYQLLAVSEEGLEYAFDVYQINYTPTTVRRTWGSIKAMFQ